MDLEKLLKQREAYSGKILKLGIQIAGIFLVPVVIISVIHKIFEIPFMYLFPVAFILSWVGVAILYRRYDREIRDIEHKIRELRLLEEQNNDAQDAL